MWRYEQLEIKMEKNTKFKCIHREYSSTLYVGMARKNGRPYISITTEWWAEISAKIMEITLDTHIPFDSVLWLTNLLDSWRSSLGREPASSKTAVESSSYIIINIIFQTIFFLLNTIPVTFIEWFYNYRDDIFRYYERSSLLLVRIKMFLFFNEWIQMYINYAN